MMQCNPWLIIFILITVFLFPFLLYSCSRFCCTTIPIFTVFLVPGNNIIREETDGSITIGEVKSSHTPSPGKAASQLQHSAEILSTVFPDVNTVAITVNMASPNPTRNLDHFDTTEHQSMTGFKFSGLSLSLGDIVDFARNNDLSVDFDLFKKANKEAMECVQKRKEKQQLRFLQSSQPDSTTTVTVSPFGMLLQNALGHNRSHYKYL